MRKNPKNAVMPFLSWFEFVLRHFWSKNENGIPIWTTGRYSKSHFFAAKIFFLIDFGIPTSASDRYSVSFLPKNALKTNSNPAQTSMSIEFIFFPTDSCANVVPLSAKISRNHVLKFWNFRKFCQNFDIFFLQNGPDEGTLFRHGSVEKKSLFPMS